jgi:hypothetical protein
MRDLVRFHIARLPYDAEAVLADAANPVRRRLLDQAGVGGKHTQVELSQAFCDSHPDPSFGI